MKKILFLFLLLPFSLLAQRDTTGSKPARGKRPGGTLMLGMRTTTSLFSDAGYPGMGVGGQFRLRFTDKLNSDWFADYITTDIGGLGKRTDYHIGWSVLFYPFAPESTHRVSRGTYSRLLTRKFVPYALAGHCFDYTQVSNNDLLYPHSVERWSSAIQAGAGVHWMLTKTFDASFTSQYMMHLGSDVESEITKDLTGKDVLVITKHDGLSLEGHLLLTLSLNVRVGDLWSRK